MLTHAQIWAAIDRLAARAGLSASGLAKRAGLDPTTFNKSKRITRQGRARWPSTESVAKSLEATGVSIDEFVGLINDRASSTARTLPCADFAEANAGGLFDAAGHPVAKGWDKMPFPALADEHAYALKAGGGAMAPIYPDGAAIVVSPAAPVRRGDRAIVLLRSGELIAVELRRTSAKGIEVRSLAADHTERALATEDIAWMARIVWASQ